MTREEFLAQQELLKLQEEIEKKEQEVKLYEDNLKVAETKPAGGLLAGYEPTSTPIPGSWNDPTNDFDKQDYNRDVLELSNLIDMYEQNNAEYYSTFLPKTAPPEDSQVQDFEDTEQKFDKDFTEQDLLAPWKAEYPGVPEHQLLDIVSMYDPELYAKLDIGGQEDIIESDMPESAQWGFGGFLSSTTRAMLRQQKKSIMFDVPAMNLAMFNFDPSAPLSSQEDQNEEFKKILRATPEYANARETDLDFLVHKTRKDGELTNKLANKIIQDGNAWNKKYFEDDVDMQAYLEWWGSKEEHIRREDGGAGLDKIATNAILNGLPSIMQSRAMGLLGSFIGGLVGIPVGVAAGLFAKSPAAAIATSAAVKRGFQRAGELGGQALFGYQLEGASHMASAVDYLTNEQSISKEKFSRIIDEEKDIYKNYKTQKLEQALPLCK